jgi:hypothetical protein
MKQETKKTKHTAPRKDKQPYEEPKLETREKLAEVTEQKILISGMSEAD